MSKLVIIKILLAVTICFQQVAPCLSLFISSTDFHHQNITHTVKRAAPVQKAKQLSFQNHNHLHIWAVLSKHHGHLPASSRLKTILWTSLVVGVLFVAFLNIALFVSRKWQQSTGFSHVLKRPIYLLLGQLTV
ncbi:MAG: hypothetical protein V4577_19810 [Bacteroidota bacterium]